MLERSTVFQHINSRLSADPCVAKFRSTDLWTRQLGDDRLILPPELRRSCYDRCRLSWRT